MAPLHELKICSACLLFKSVDESHKCEDFVERLLARNENLGFAYVTSAVAYAQLGREGEARAAMARAKQLLPYLDADSLGSRLREPGHRAKLVAGLRKAGLE